jgi:hypothetical protein
MYEQGLEKLLAKANAALISANVFSKTDVFGVGSEHAVFNNFFL